MPPVLSRELMNLEDALLYEILSYRTSCRDPYDEYI